MAVVTADIDQWNSLQIKTQKVRIASVFETFRQAGIEPILIKGLASAHTYPQHHLRYPGDIDIAVAPQDHQRAYELARSDPKINAYLIDLHKGLRDLDRIDWDDLFKNSVLIDLEGAKIRILREEDHLRVLSTHWLLDGGRFKDKLWDIYYAVENRSENFDWDRCLEIVEPNRRRWVICAIALTHKYLGLRVDELPFVDELSFIPGWITQSIEKEWELESLEPVLASVHDKRLLFRQIRRRLPPNPIRATIEANGDLYGSRRYWYQIAVLARRALPFARNCLWYAAFRIRGESK